MRIIIDTILISTLSCMSAVHASEITILDQQGAETIQPTADYKEWYKKNRIKSIQERRPGSFEVTFTNNTETMFIYRDSMNQEYGGSCSRSIDKRISFMDKHRAQEWFTYCTVITKNQRTSISRKSCVKSNTCCSLQ